jgi:hypothetical protein
LLGVRGRKRVCLGIGKKDEVGGGWEGVELEMKMGIRGWGSEVKETEWGWGNEGRETEWSRGMGGRMGGL